MSAGPALLLLSVADLPPGYAAWVRITRRDDGEVVAEIDTDVYDGLGVIGLGCAAERRLLEEIEPCDDDGWSGIGSGSGATPASGAVSAAPPRGRQRLAP